ncbi:SanA/YdcF family protein [Nonomuraea sediminis]|uniref:SanA/YdcF family protein n=1 Tax=Nonomuraea sediminis TaxID=2835864 RepID=UPI00202A495B|nr:ElyC/SanA/YdcF family protein [Nonomuraea sediminis]
MAKLLGNVRHSRKAQRRAYQALVLVSVLTLAPTTWAVLYSAGHREVADTDGWLRQVPDLGTALVLGARVNGEEPTPMLARRLDIAAELYRAGKVKALLLSGDNSRVGYDEPTTMRDYLTARGIPASAMVLDYAGFDTWDSCVRARKVFGAQRLTVVTQLFHLPRAVALCRAAGLETYGVGDDSAKQWPAPTYSYAVRELFATGKAVADALVFKSDPVFPGPPETSLRRVLAG